MFSTAVCHLFQKRKRLFLYKEVFKSQVLNNNEDHPVGEIVEADKRGFVIQLKGGQLSLLEVQKEGKNKMDYKSFINGNQGLLGKKVD